MPKKPGKPKPSKPTKPKPGGGGGGSACCMRFNQLLKMWNAMPAGSTEIAVFLQLVPGEPVREFLIQSSSDFNTTNCTISVFPLRSIDPKVLTCSLLNYFDSADYQ
ncbi:hypothetical protein [Paenibacillus glycanilyticus]|uniref:hypothetical protein n=1 Tax=Paenibacillus glycanilyticus TaxID=126569 RepID=UPI000FDA1D08|nr:hypothetical protein [Paenibacillus glycanilyticus]